MLATADSAKNHAAKVHGDRIPCPLAVERNCNDTFTSVTTARRHADSLHRGLRLSYPKAEEFHCKATFTTAYNAKEHVKSLHFKSRVPCPLADEFDCEETFSNLSNANKHAKRHSTSRPRYACERERQPCPLATEEKCDRTFLYAKSAMQHAAAAHGYGQQTMYPCPLAEEYGCEQVFVRKEGAERHADTQHLGIRMRYPCPEAARFSCQVHFLDKNAAARHAKGHTHPVGCSRQGCKAQFKTVEGAWAHESSPDHVAVSTFKLFVCTVPSCRIAVAGKRLVGETTMHRHMEKHVSRGHVQNSVEYPPRQVEEMFRHSRHRLYWQISLGSEEIALENTPHASEEDDETQDNLPSEVPEEELLSFQPGMLSEERRLCILEGNRVLWERKRRPKVSFSNLGLTCVGPDAISNNLVTRRCPNEVVIDLDTARVIQTSHPNTYILSPRCVKCKAHLVMTWHLQAEGVKLHAENIICTEPGCDQQSFHESGMCCRHFALLLLDAQREKTDTAHAKARKTFESAARKQWVYPPKYDIVRRCIDDILQNKRPSSDLVVLDDEYSNSSRQLWEIAMIEQISGDTLINTIVEHPNGVDHGSLEEDLHLRLLSKMKAESVYSPSRGLSIDRMDVHKIAATLRQKGISRDTIFLVWHKHPMDLRLLREFLESSGYDNILPPDENCISLIQLYRENLFKDVPKDQWFWLRLEVVFPLMFPRHDLVGLNHQALVDCQQTRLIYEGANQLCKPVEERGHEWRPDTVARSSQTSILDWVRDRVPNNDNGKTIPPLEDHKY
ncbi:hypothetical protein K469DRAFT_725428 [Zopfia rhizophila CBS 207.26]|uniref:C2H2-type domain-containing protein n=1 Tax=Zopfia rhizophila CBS 207.26 TaxID=1314779 RepID=A0A6A6ECD0_9PEZI|nr:hypothetical protein K469DRAFT_725428 [Zopfia rhizophila CBS 207.26]